MATQCIARSCSQTTAYTSSIALRSFVQLAPRRYLHSTPLSILDFLVPNIAPRAGRHVWSQRPIGNHVQRYARRGFTSTSSRQGTTVIQNPRKDDDGNEMLIEITPRASNRLKQIMANDNNPDLALRIQVESGGCHGFQYLMSLTTLSATPTTKSESTSTSTSSISPSEMPSRCTKNHDHHDHDHTHEHSPALNTSSSDPNVMPSCLPGSSPLSTSESKPSASAQEVKSEDIDEDADTVFATEDGAGAKVVMDGPSLELLKGSKVDYTMELIGSQFKIVDNPLATSSCGCGTSFDIKA